MILAARQYQAGIHACSVRPFARNTVARAKKAHARSQLVAPSVGVLVRRWIRSSEGSSEDRLCFGKTLAENCVALEVVFLGGRVRAQPRKKMLQIAEVIHDFGNTHGSGIVD